MEPLAALTFVGLVAAAAVAFVVLPFVRRPKQRGEREPQEQESPHLALLERRDRALAALKELEFDHRTGKVSDVDYRSLVGPLRREAAESLGLLAGEDARAIPPSKPRKAPGACSRRSPERRSAAAAQRSPNSSTR